MMHLHRPDVVDDESCKPIVVKTVVSPHIFFAEIQMELTLTMETGNPIIKHVYTADPTVVVYHDTVCLYTGHDEAPPGTHQYVMNEWLGFSSRDLVHWQDHSALLKPVDFSWGKSNAYASCIVQREGKFYWYVATTPANSTKKAIGVAIADSPTGPFTDARGSPLIDEFNMPAGSDNFDPSVLIDDDNQAYIFWGKNVCFYARLKNNLVELDSEIKTVDLPEFMEGAHIHKRNGWYYLSYGYGMPEKVGYAMSRSIHGPWQFKGILNELAGNCETNRPAIVDFKGKSYFFYHNGGLKDGGSHRRSVCVDYLYYNADGTMKRVVMTSEGVQAGE
jgi:beta-xylosidase